MATIKPFAALRPRPELAAQICELPYDVLSSDEARELAAGNPFSFFRISKPEVDLAATLDPCDPRVYARGKANFTKALSEGWLAKDPQPCFYLYRQVMDRHCQVGLVAVASCEEYLQGAIKRHELTRPDKVEDRVRHIEALNAQTGPAFLVQRATPALDEFVARRTAQPPAVDFTARDGIRHTAWTIGDAAGQAFLQTSLAAVRTLYIADGHHRTEAAARVFQSRKGAGNSGYFLAVIFPHDQMQILPYHRLLKDLQGLSPEALLHRLESVFLIRRDGGGPPGQVHEVGLYLQGRWHTLHFRPQFLGSGAVAEGLDVALLQKHVLAPLFGIDDPRTSERIDFVGGVRGTQELERRVNAGEFACAFALFPTRMEDLMAIADAGGLMPPKSTWFEPKLRDAMFCHLI
jgi:uncharacterized protein (DUF1015 family)